MSTELSYGSLLHEKLRPDLLLFFSSLPIAPGLFCDPGGDFTLLVLPADPVQGCAFHRHRGLHPGDGLHGGSGRACGKASGSR